MKYEEHFMCHDEEAVFGIRCGGGAWHRTKKPLTSLYEGIGYCKILIAAAFAGSVGS